MNPFPPEIKKLAVISPAGIPDRESTEKSLNLIRSWGIEAIVASHAFEKGEEDYFASNREKRAEDLNNFINDQSTDMILCTRGGYGSAQILPLIDWKTLKERKLIIGGFSDITALHMGMLSKNAGIPIACQMITKLHNTLKDTLTANSMKATLHGIPQQAPLTSVNPGNAQGHLITANLSILTSLCGSEYLPDFHNAILVIEDISELPRIIDRHMTQLFLSGILPNLSALIFADFTECGTDEDILRIIKRTAYNMNIPIYSGLYFGHELPSLSFICGKNVEIKNDILFF